MEGAREREGLQERSSMGFLFVESSLPPLVWGDHDFSLKPQFTMFDAGAEARLVETDKAGQGLLRGQEETGEKCECETRVSSGCDHTAGWSQGDTAIQY